MYGSLHISYYLCAVLFFITAAFNFKKKSPLTKSVIFFTVFILSGDAFSLLLAFLKIATYKEALLRYLLTTIILAVIVGGELVNNRMRNFAKAILRILLVVALIIVFLPMPENQWPSYPFLINQVIWVVVTLVALLDQLKKEDPSPLWRRAYFWFMAGNFCFYCFSFLLFPLRASSLQGLWNSQLHNDLILWGCVFLYGAMTLGIVLDRTQPSVPYAQ